MRRAPRRAHGGAPCDKENVEVTGIDAAQCPHREEDGRVTQCAATELPRAPLRDETLPIANSGGMEGGHE